MLTFLEHLHYIAPLATETENLMSLPWLIDYMDVPNNMSLFNCACVIHVQGWSESVERIYITATFMQLPADV